MNLKYKIKIGNKAYDLKSNACGGTEYMRSCRRSVVRLDFLMQENEFNKIGFKDNISWVLLELREENGKEETIEYDNSIYSMVCDKVIHFDGTVSIYLGKPTEIEILKAKYENMEKEIMKLSKKGLITSKDLKEIIK